LNGKSFSNGLMIGTGAGVLTNGVTGATFNGGLSNACTVFLSQDTFFNKAIVTNAATFGFSGAISNSFVQTGGAFTLLGKRAISNSLVNSGSVTLNGNATITATPANTGTLNLLNNTLTITPAWANAGTVVIAGGTLAGGNATNNNTVTGSGALNSLLVNAGALFVTNR